MAIALIASNIVWGAVVFYLIKALSHIVSVQSGEKETPPHSEAKPRREELLNRWKGNEE